MSYHTLARYLKAASAVVVSQTLPLPMSAWSRLPFMNFMSKPKSVSRVPTMLMIDVVSVGWTRASTVKVPVIAVGEALAYPVLPLKLADASASPTMLLGWVRVIVPYGVAAAAPLVTESAKLPLASPRRQ